MTRIFLMALAGLWLATAFSFEAAPDSTLLITDESGRTVGEGKIEDDEAELDLLAGFDGPATLTVTAADGSVQSYEVVVGEGGHVTILEPSGSTDLESALQQDGFDVDVERDDSVGRVDRPGGDDDDTQAGDGADEDNSGPGGSDQDDRDDNGGSGQEGEDDGGGHHDGRDDGDADDGQHHGRGNGDDDGSGHGGGEDHD